jgi:hypothetical protein
MLEPDPFSIFHFSFGHFSGSHFVPVRVISWIVSRPTDKNDPRNNTNGHEQKSTMPNQKWKMNLVATALGSDEAALVHTNTDGSTNGPICGPL